MREKSLYNWKADRMKQIVLIIVCLIPFLWWLLPYALNAASEFTVTDRRVRIKKVTGGWTELPMDNIGTIVRTFWWGRLIIKTASGMIAVWGFADRDKVFEIISQRMITRQTENNTTSSELPEL